MQNHYFLSWRGFAVVVRRVLHSYIIRGAAPLTILYIAVTISNISLFVM